MQIRSAVAAIFGGLGIAIAACTGRPKTASVGGDLYLLMQNGDVKRGAGNTVRLLGDSGPLRESMQGVCRWYAEQRYGVAALGRRALAADMSSLDAINRAERLSTQWQDSETAARAGVRVRMMTALIGHKVAEAATGVNGHYQFAGLAPARYVLWAETEIGDHHYTWWAPIALQPGDSVKKDLDNSTESDSLFYCEQYADSAMAAESLAAAARLNPLHECYREAERRTSGYLEDRIGACNRKFGHTGTRRY